MKTLYTLTVETKVRVPAGTLHMAITHKHTFLFATASERQKTLEWVRAQGWEHSFNIDHVMTDADARAEITKQIEGTCAHFHHPVPTFVEG